MNVYTYSQARQRLASLLDEAAKEGEVRIKRKDGTVFVVRPEPRADSPLDVEGVDLNVTGPEIVQYIREGRRPPYLRSDRDAERGSDTRE